MRDAKMPDQALTMRWIPVQTADGRIHMEARWVLEDTVEHPLAA